jgi:integration host factor subunit alpha
MTLKKIHISQKIASDCGFTRNEAAEVLDKLIDIMKKKLITGEAIIVPGFGKWRVRSKRPRKGRNPQTREHIVIDARRVVTWKYSPVLKKAVNGSGKGLKK